MLTFSFSYIDSHSLKDPTKMYRFITNDLMTQVFNDYRRTKQRESLMTGGTISHQYRNHMTATAATNSLPFCTSKMMDSSSSLGNYNYDLGHDHDTRRFLHHDSQHYIRIWSEILSNCIDLHIRTSQDTFHYTIGQFRLLVRELLLHCSNCAPDNLRISLANWVDYTCNIVIMQNQPKNFNHQPN